LSELWDGELVSAYIEQCTDNGSHHISKKSVGLDDEGPIVGIVLNPFCSHHFAIVCLGVSVELGEGCEIGVVE